MRSCLVCCCCTDCTRSTWRNGYGKRWSRLRPALAAHGGAVELVGVEDGLVRLRLAGSCDGCPSSAATMRQLIEEAIFGKAPDATAVEVEGLTDSPTAQNGHARVPLPML